MNRRALRYWAEYVAFRTCVCILQSLSPRRCACLARFVAFLVHRILPRKLTRYDVARQNLRTAFGDQLSDRETDELIYRMWIHLCRLVAEIVQLPRELNLGKLHEAIVFRKHRDIVRAMCSSRPVIVLSGHFGNWEVALSLLGLFGFPMSVVARELDNPYLNKWFDDFRRQTGHRTISKKGGGAEMVERLEAGGKLALLGDQDAGSGGIFVDFFGRPASTFKSIALLALEYKAVICVGYALRLHDGFATHAGVRFEMGCEQVIDPLAIDSDDEIREMTQQYTAALERLIRRAPEQYFWVHRRWKSVPGQRKRRCNRRRKAG